MSELNEQLVKKAIEGAKNSYSPYSKYTVGAALLTVGGEIFQQLQCGSGVLRVNRLCGVIFNF